MQTRPKNLQLLFSRLYNTRIQRNVDGPRKKKSRQCVRSNKLGRTKENVEFGAPDTRKLFVQIWSEEKWDEYKEAMEKKGNVPLWSEIW